MRRTKVRTSALRSIAEVVVFFAAWQAKAQEAKTAYPALAPLEQYLMPDRNEEITPKTNSKAWGADLPGSPIITFQNPEERLTVFLIPVLRWSDGTPARPQGAH